ncbi:[FeFe] hydrogenase H-cluster maturation GTPase HydF [bacterium]|nr:[FeFe] hydrogenase H-cluster maturation GTPase HydF [bacterium]
MKSLKQNRLHVGFFGKTNVGKSSLINKITGQEVSIVSDIAGTTTDIVEKSMELLPIGPVTFLDTAGLDDKTELGEKRIAKTMKVLDRVDVAVIVSEPGKFDEYEKDLIEKLEKLGIPYFVIVNKCDEAAKQLGSYAAKKDKRRAGGQEGRLNESGKLKVESGKLSNFQFSTLNFQLNSLHTSTSDSLLVSKFKQSLINLLPDDYINPPKIAGDLIPEKSTVVLVTPIDKEAPKGRLILPQVQTIRDLLDSNCIIITVKESELQKALDDLKQPPALVITDSQAFKKVSEIVPEDIPLTSFSILFARLKGDLNAFTEGADAIDSLKDGDKVLIFESCTHHAIEDDIGRVKIPNLLRKKTGKDLIIENFAGHDFPDISDYKLIIHCGACMTNRREVLSRIIKANEQNIPITNYGIVISYCLGILPRALKIFTSKI